MLVVVTNQWHHWYWTGTFLIESAYNIQTQKSWWFGIYAAGMYLSITASTVMYLAYVRKAPAIYKKQAYWFAIGGLLPLGFRLLSGFFGVVFMHSALGCVFNARDREFLWHCVVSLQRLSFNSGCLRSNYSSA